MMKLNIKFMEVLTYKDIFIQTMFVLLLTKKSIAQQRIMKHILESKMKKYKVYAENIEKLYIVVEADNITDAYLKAYKAKQGSSKPNSLSDNACS